MTTLTDLADASGIRKQQAIALTDAEEIFQRQGMTTLTGAIGTAREQSVEPWNTSGAAAPWQIFTSSNAAFVAAPGLGTMPITDFGVAVLIGIEPLKLQLPQLEGPRVKEQLPLFPEDRRGLLNDALLNLMSYVPEPDQPNDQDVGPQLQYTFPR